MRLRYEEEKTQNSIPPKTAPCHSAAPAPAPSILLLPFLSLWDEKSEEKRREREAKKEQRRVAGTQIVNLGESKVDHGKLELNGIAYIQLCFIFLSLIISKKNIVKFFLNHEFYINLDWS